MDYLRLLRTDDWLLGFFWIPILGAVLVSFSFERIVFISLISFCLFAYAYAINNYFDVEIDKKHSRKIESNRNPLAKENIDKKKVLAIISILFIFPLILSFYLNFTGFVLVFFSILFSTLYSARGIRLKERTGLDLLTHGFMFGLTPFLAGVALGGGDISFYSLYIALLFLVINCNVLLVHQMIDYKEDIGNTKSTAIDIGLKNSFFLFVLLQVIFLVSFIFFTRFFVVDWWIYYLIMFLLLWVPLKYFRKNRKVYGKLIVWNC